MCLALPWEVIEGVIDHSHHDRKALHSFSLTCRQLRPRSYNHLVSRVQITSREQAFEFCDFLRVNPHLLPLVQSISIHPNDLMPYPLLSILPNLTEISLTTSSETWWTGPTITLHRSVLTSCQLLGTRIQTLQISRLIFPTDLELARVLLAFANLKELVFEHIRIKRDAPHLLAVTRRQHLARKLQLRTLAISGEDAVDDATTPFVFGLSQATVEALSIQGECIRSLPFGQPSNWARLQSLTLRSKKVDIIQSIIGFFKVFSSPTLKEVSIALEGYAMQAIAEWRKEDSVAECPELERELLRFLRQEITFFNLEPLHSHRKKLWAQELGQCFPAMRERNAFKVESDPSTSICHERGATSLVVSPNSKWIATGSEDYTIILWNSDGQMTHEWLAHIRGVNSLAFSPDSQRLVSGGWDKKVSVWDISQDPLRVATLEDHADTVWSCAWSPDGTMIASACGQSTDPTVRLWDAVTFQQVRVLTGSESFERPIRFICFSPDGRWLAARNEEPHCYVWDVTSRRPHADLRGHERSILAVAFHPNSTRVATASGDHTVRIWDVYTGWELRTLKGHTDVVNDVAFSPDGTLVLSASEDRTVKIWDWSNGALRLSLGGHRWGVNAACFSPCARYVASASSDNLVKLWKVSDGSCMATFSEHGNSVVHVAFSPDGRTLSSAAGTAVFIRRLSDVIPEEGLS